MAGDDNRRIVLTLVLGGGAPLLVIACIAVVVLLGVLAAIGHANPQCSAGAAASPTGTSAGGALVAGADVPTGDPPLFAGAAERYALGPQGAAILAAIDAIESDFGRSKAPGVQSGASSNGAEGPMQIPRSGVASAATRAPNDPTGKPPNVYDEPDAIYSAANYLAHVGLNADPSTWRGALLFYNQSDQWVTDILDRAASYYDQALASRTPAAVSAPSVASGPSPGAALPTQGPLTIPPAANDPAGPISLAPGQPTYVAATFYGGPADHSAGTTGAWGDILTGQSAFAELSPGVPPSQVTRANADMLGGLPYRTPLRITNPATGASVVAYKLDIGAGQPLSSTLNGYHYRIDLWWQLARQLGITGSSVVQVTLANGSAQTVSSAFGCADQAAGTTPGNYVDPFLHTKNLVPQRIDMGVDYDGSGEIDALGDAKIVFAGTGIGGGWTCDTPANGGVVYQLVDGQYSGRYVYVTEDIVPTVKADPNKVIPAGTQIATFSETKTGTGCIEIGWASGSRPAPMAAALGQQATVGDAGANLTYCGNNMSQLLASKGAPAGLTEGRSVVGDRC